MRQMKYHYFKKHGHKLIYVVNMSITRHWNCHLGKQRHIGHSYKSPESGRQYINQPPQLSHAGKEQPTRLNWWQVGCQILEKSNLTTNGKQLCTQTLKHWNSELETPTFGLYTDSAKYPTKNKNTHKRYVRFRHFATSGTFDAEQPFRFSEGKDKP